MDDIMAYRNIAMRDTSIILNMISKFNEQVSNDKWLGAYQKLI